MRQAGFKGHSLPVAESGDIRYQQCDLRGGALNHQPNQCLRRAAVRTRRDNAMEHLAYQ